jgi:hypothetical protein
MAIVPPTPALQPLVGQSLIIESSRSHSNTPHLVGILWTSDQPDAETSLPDNTPHSQKKDVHDAGGIPTHNPSKPAAAAPRHTPNSHWDRQHEVTTVVYTAV